MPAKTLGELLEGVAGRGLGSWRTPLIRHIRLDSRLVGRDELFVAVPGSNSHGDRYLADAARRGAAAVLLGEDSARRLPAALPLPGYVVGDPRAVTATLSARLYDHAADRLTLTAVTGTNGKTTVVYMVAKLLERLGIAHGFWSTAQVAGAGEGFRPLMTTPEAPDLHRFLWEVWRRGGQQAVLEVSSHAVALKRVQGLRFAVAAVTNVGADHLDFHGSVQAYVAAKRALVEALDAGATAVLNADDPTVAGFARATAARVLTYGVRGGQLRAVDVATSGTQTRFAVVTGGGVRLSVRLPLVGMHNVYNALAALAVAKAHGIPLGEAAAALEDFQPPVRRLESAAIGPFTLINDVAMNRGSYDAVLRAMAALARPLVVVNAVRGNRGPAINREIAEVLADWDQRLHFAPLIVSVSRSAVARLPGDYQVRPEELTAFLEAAQARGLAVHCHQELEDAIREGAERVPPGGILLLLGTFGMDAGPELAAQCLRRRAG